MLGIIGAMQQEVDGYIEAMKNCTTTSIGSIKFVRGQLYGQDIVVAKSGIGKVNAAMAASLMINVFAVKEIINSGVAGGVGKGLKIGDIVIASSTIQYDVDLRAEGYALGEVEGIGSVSIACSPSLASKMQKSACQLGLHAVTGIIVSGDQFVADTTKASWLYNTFGAMATDMESAAIGQVCYLMGVDYGAMRVISDNGGNSATIDYAAFFSEAAICSINVVKTMLTGQLGTKG